MLPLWRTRGTDQPSLLQNWRASGAFHVTIRTLTEPRGPARLEVSWKPNHRWQTWNRPRRLFTSRRDHASMQCVQPEQPPQPPRTSLCAS